MKKKVEKLKKLTFVTKETWEFEEFLMNWKRRKWREIQERWSTEEVIRMKKNVESSREFKNITRSFNSFWVIYHLVLQLLQDFQFSLSHHVFPWPITFINIQIFPYKFLGFNFIYYLTLDRYKIH